MTEDEISMDCSITSHCQAEFLITRLADKISNEDIQESLKVELNIKKVFKAGQGAGKSGSFFFFSHDNKLIIKTVTPKEKSLLELTLPNLNDHFSEGISLLARIYGMYTINSAQYASVSFLLM